MINTLCVVIIVQQMVHMKSLCLMNKSDILAKVKAELKNKLAIKCKYCGNYYYLKNTHVTHIAYICIPCSIHKFNLTNTYD